LAIVLALLVAVLAVVGTWNPWSLVWLHSQASDPVLGGLIFAVLLLVADWLLIPVRSEAINQGRVRLRVVLVILAVLTVLGFAVTNDVGVFRYDVRTVARSADGTRSVAVVTQLGGEQLHSMVGSGIGQRDAGSLGRPCGLDVRVHFIGTDEVVVDTVYGTFHLHLDPGTGRPKDRLGPDCSA
jgi:hypothetical protein